jgi:hypothetical protein
VFAFNIGFYALPMAKALGFTKAFGILSAIGVATVIPVFFLIFYGEGIRRRQGAPKERYSEQSVTQSPGE